jgi:hypothetical protein
MSFICNQAIPNICEAKKLTLGNNGLMFLPPLEKTFDLINIQLKSPKNQEFSIDQFYEWFTCVSNHFKNIKAIIFIRSMSRKFNITIYHMI